MVKVGEGIKSKKEKFIDKRAFSHNIGVHPGKGSRKWCDHTARTALGSLEKTSHQIGLLYQLTTLGEQELPVH